MTVRELIEALQNEHPDADVMIECDYIIVDNDTGMPTGEGGSEIQTAAEVKTHNGTGTLRVLITSDIMSFTNY